MDSRWLSPRIETALEELQRTPRRVRIGLGGDAAAARGHAGQVGAARATATRGTAAGLAPLERRSEAGPHEPWPAEDAGVGRESRVL